MARTTAHWQVKRHSKDVPTCSLAKVPARRRGAKPTISDAEELAAIRADLAASPWQGEGHRKVWARLRVRDGIRVGQRVTVE